MSARRYNKGKTRYELIPRFALEQLALVYTRGAHKYSLYKDNNGNTIKGSEIPISEVHNYELIDDGAENWRNGLSWKQTLGSVDRHIAAFENGEEIDPDLGTYHLANAAWGLFSLLEYYKIYPQGDDRSHAYLKPKRIGLDVDDVIADFTGHLLKYLGKEDYVIQHWADPVVDKGFKEILALPIDKAKEFWLTMPPKEPASELKFEPSAYITARCIDPAWTQEWLDINKFPKAPLVCTGNGATKSKVDSAKELGLDIFVDDKFQNFVELTNAGIFTYLFDATYNRHHQVGHRRLMSLKDI